jgi:hypothetical protein
MTEEHIIDPFMSLNRVFPTKVGNLHTGGYSCATIQPYHLLSENAAQ